MSVAETGTADGNSIHETVGPDIEADAEYEGGFWSPEDLLEAGATASDVVGWEDNGDRLRDLATTPKSERDEEWDQEYQQMMRTVQMIGGAVIGIAVVTIVVNEVLTTSSVNNSSGPFSGVIDSLESTGVAAMSLLVVGLLVAAASKLMTFFGGGF